MKATPLTMTAIAEGPVIFSETIRLNLYRSLCGLFGNNEADDMTDWDSKTNTSKMTRYGKMKMDKLGYRVIDVTVAERSES